MPGFTIITLGSPTRTMRAQELLTRRGISNLPVRTSDRSGCTWGLKIASSRLTEVIDLLASVGIRVNTIGGSP